MYLAFLSHSSTISSTVPFVLSSAVHGEDGGIDAVETKNVHVHVNHRCYIVNER